MTTIFKRHFSINLVLLLALIICSHSPKANSAIESFEISIQDELLTETGELLVVCKARHERVGGAKVRTGGIVKFTYNVSDASPENRVFCDMSVGGKQGLYAIFDYNRDLRRCGNDHKCRWTVTPPGLYQYYDGYQHLIYPW